MIMMKTYNLRKLNKLYKEVVGKSEKYFPQPKPKPKEYRNIKYMVYNPEFADKTVNELMQIVDDSQKLITEWKEKRQKEVEKANKKFLTALTNGLVETGIFENKEFARKFADEIFVNYGGIDGAMVYISRFIKMATGKNLGDK